MLKITWSEEYYPTPESLLKQITHGIDWQSVDYVLEPSAGRGNIVEFVRRKKEAAYPPHAHYKNDVDIDCIEIEPELRAILKEKGYRVVHDDFLTFHTYKHYDLILMNPPFSVGARHMLNAIEVQQTTGGAIICLLNAETLRNPYSNERKELGKKLEQYGAEIKYYENAFLDAERPTEVEVACVKVIIPEPERKTTIFATLREKGYEEYKKVRENSELAESDLVSAFVAQYNRELEWGLRLYDEFLELRSKSLDGKSPVMMEIQEREYGSSEDFSVNKYVQAVRRRYWDKFFREPRFMGRLTSNLRNEYLSQVDTFTGYDFSYWNIKTVQEDLAKRLIKGVEDCIIDLFDELSARHSWDEDLKNNIHYYNGWKTNLSWKINRRVILRLQAWNYRGELEYSPNMKTAIETLIDIEKVLNYLDSGNTEEQGLTVTVRDYLDAGITKNIRLKYFRVTFYKKGTCHITFTNERLLKKLNIYGSQRKGWLPKGYARRKYDEMDEEERAVVESFEGRESYEETLREAKYYLFDVKHSLPMLTE